MNNTNQNSSINWIIIITLMPFIFPVIGFAALFILLFWPILIAAVPVYLFVKGIKAENAKQEQITQLNEYLYNPETDTWIQVRNINEGYAR